MGIRDSTRYATTTQPFDKRALGSCSTKATSPLQCQQTSFRDQRSSSKLAIELLVIALLSISYQIFKSNELLVPATSMRACRQEELHNTCASKMAPCSLSNLCCIADPQAFFATVSRPSIDQKKEPVASLGCTCKTRVRSCRLLYSLQENGVYYTTLNHFCVQEDVL